MSNTPFADALAALLNPPANSHVWELEEALMHAASTPEQWDTIRNNIADREVGNYIADNGDENTSHPDLCEGIAYMQIGPDSALVAIWDDQGFWDVYQDTLRAAMKEFEARAMEYDDMMEEEEEEETD